MNWAGRKEVFAVTPCWPSCLMKISSLPKRNISLCLHTKSRLTYSPSWALPSFQAHRFYVVSNTPPPVEPSRGCTAGDGEGWTSGWTSMAQQDMASAIASSSCVPSSVNLKKVHTSLLYSTSSFK